MIGTEVKSVGNALRAATDRLDEYRARLAAAFQAVGEKVEARIQNEQMSGRKSDDTGLNIITGTGYNSWEVVTDVAAELLETMVYNGPQAFYLRYPEDGSGHNPKRLEIESGELRDWAEERYHDEAVSCLGILAAA